MQCITRIYRHSTTKPAHPLQGKTLQKMVLYKGKNWKRRCKKRFKERCTLLDWLGVQQES